MKKTAILIISSLLTLVLLSSCASKNKKTRGNRNPAHEVPRRIF